MNTHFAKLNNNWNADPNSPVPHVKVHGKDILLSFCLNSFVYPQFKIGDVGKITFTDCFQYRLGLTNDEGWFRGQCRFSKVAPAWGEFYEISGDLRFDESPNDWVTVGEKSENLSHFLFYFRDDTFECDARSWKFEVTKDTVIKN